MIPLKKTEELIGNSISGYRDAMFASNPIHRQCGKSSSLLVHSRERHFP